MYGHRMLVVFKKNCFMVPKPKLRKKQSIWCVFYLILWSVSFRTESLSNFLTCNYFLSFVDFLFSHIHFLLCRSKEKLFHIISDFLLCFNRKLIRLIFNDVLILLLQSFMTVARKPSPRVFGGHEPSSTCLPQCPAPKALSVSKPPAH